jgi:hypothetical protein
MRITFELIGGPLNGIYSGDLGQPSTVVNWFHASSSGQIAQEFEINCPGVTPQHHRYKVTSRIQEQDTIRIAATHEGPA